LKLQIDLYQKVVAKDRSAGAVHEEIIAKNKTKNRSLFAGTWHEFTRNQQMLVKFE
jgi:hypothetical protein